MEPIETPRLLIRPLQAADAAALAAIWADPTVTRFMGGPRDYDQVRRSLEEDARADPPPELDLWPVVEKATGRVIGHCGLTPKEIDGRDEVELVYVLARSAWGKSYATEAARALREAAFGRFGLRRLVSLIEPENAASAHVADKAGLRKEKDVLRPGGRWMAVYAAALPSAEGNGGTSLFTHAITRTPGKDFDRGLTTADLGRPDYDLMLRQHAAYVEALRGLGLEVSTLAPLEGFPDGYFVEDPAVILPEVAVITRPGAESRRGEITA
ncbi:MAG TPA: GNAT family N-acetyltransferase, partial [Anaerolineaceae bacterium]